MSKSNVILLDTNALLWLLSTNQQKSKLGKQAKLAIDEAMIVYVSAASILEIRIKQMLGKINAPVNLLQVIEQSGLTILPISAEHADSLTVFKKLANHDPFDRILLAQAYCEPAILLTSDNLLLSKQPKYTLNASI